MTIYYITPGDGKTPTKSGGTRKLLDHVAILQAHGFDARTIWGLPVPPPVWKPEDIVVIPEVYGDGHHLSEPGHPALNLVVPLERFIPGDLRWLYFVQNAYLIDVVDARRKPPGLRVVRDPNRHPFMEVPNLVGILTESQHSEDILRQRFPNLKVPLIRTHSSGNGRDGKDAGFSYGLWPRDKRILMFGYKRGNDSQENLNLQIRDELALPPGWEVFEIVDKTDAEVQELLRMSAILASPFYEEGLCAPAQEAMLSGCINVCWPGGPHAQTQIGGPMEYLKDRGVIANQDDVGDLRRAIQRTAASIDKDPVLWATMAQRWADWLTTNYSRAAEITELCTIFEELCA